MALLDDYDQTKEAFGEMVKNLLLVTDCSDGWKQCIREAGAAVYHAEWAVVRKMNLDRMFLAWLGSPGQLWLTNTPDVDHWLPNTAMIGVEHMKPDERRAALAARDVRIERCKLHLDKGWSAEDAVIFIASREEWREAGGYRMARSAA